MEVGFQNEPLPEVDVIGPYDDEEGDEELKPKKKKKSKKTSERLDGGEVKKKKKSKRHTADGLKREKESKRRSSNVNTYPESSPNDADDINQHKTQRPKRVSAKGPMSHLPGGGNSVAYVAPARSEIDAANGVHRTMPRSVGFEHAAAFSERTNPPTLQQERTVNWETSDGTHYSDDNNISVITPLTAPEGEPSVRSLRDDVEDSFVPLASIFSSTSPPGKSERVQHGVYWEKNGLGIDLRKLNRERRSLEAPILDSRLSPDEKRRVSLPSSLLPIQAKDHDGQPRHQKRKNGPFPVDESYDTGHGATTHQKSNHRLSYASTAESYAQLDTENGAQGGTVDYVATRRLTTKDLRRKENREHGPSYFASSEQYNDENIRADTQLPSPLDVEAQSSDRAGAFSIGRSDLMESNQDSGNLFSEWMPEVDQGEQMAQVAPEQQVLAGSAFVVGKDIGRVKSADYKPTSWYCSCWFKVLATLVVIAAIAAAIAIPLTSSKDDDSVSFTDDQIVARKEQLLPVLTSRSNETQLINTASPQGAAFTWMISQDLMSPIESESRTPRETELMIQRYTLAVFYYSTMGDNWFSSDGWLDGKREECTWEHLDCINKDILTQGQSPEFGGIGLVSEQHGRHNTDGNLRVDCSSTIDSCGQFFHGDGITANYKSLGTNTELALDLNGLSGTLTTEFQALSNLANLDLANNYFSGNFNSIFAEMNKLVVLVLTSDRITGSLTSDIQQFTNLELLDLGDTDIGGTLPSEIGAITNIRSLLIEGMGLTGTIPTELGNLSALDVLYMDLNAFTGPVPSEICSLPNLRDVRSNCRNECSCQVCGECGR